MKVFLVLSLICLVQSAWAGNSVNNGIDQLDDKGDAVWFVGNREIKACVEVDRDFGVDTNEAYEAITHAFSTWDRYFQNKGLKQALRDDGLEFSTSVNLHRGCVGGEDVAFYLGGKSNFLIQAAMGFRHPLAFSERVSYDETLRWGKGFVWLAPPSDFKKEGLDWSHGNHLFGALLHEIGHLYGCGHIDSTIMRADLSQNILDSRDDFLHIMTSIDSGKQLYLCENCGGKFYGTVLRSDIVSRLVGRVSGADFEAKLELENDPTKLPHGNLTVRDGKKTYVLTLTAKTQIAAAFSDALLFHVPISQDTSKKETFATRHAGQVFLATLKYGNRSINLIYKRNMEIFMDMRAPYADQLSLFDPDISTNTVLVLVPKQ